MKLPLMPKATSVWLVENTGLTFEQIAEFCGLHVLEVQGIADGEVSTGLVGQDPILANQVTREEIERCEKDNNAKLQLKSSVAQEFDSKRSKQKTSKYTPVARRQDKPDAISWLLKNLPGINDTQICRLIGTTKKTILSIRDKSHWNMANITAHDPVLLGLCTQSELDNLADKLRKEAEKKKELEEEIQRFQAKKKEEEELKKKSS